jgi:hypothetical protein
MFCPQCEAEYRFGFTKCSDCGVDLVEHLDDDANIPRNSEGLELHWSGVSQELSNRIDEALDAAHIFHKVTAKDIGLLPNLAQSVNLVWIDPRDRATSRSVLENILVGSGTKKGESELAPPDIGRMNPLGLDRKVYSSPTRRDAPFESVSLVESDAPGEPAPDDIVGDFDPIYATAEIWSGGDAQLPEYIKACLTENGIGCVLADDGGKHLVKVLPADEARAKEIVREIVEESPPQ